MRLKFPYIPQDIWATPLFFVLKRDFGLILVISLDKKPVRV